jgi:hypothetical protein
MTADSLGGVTRAATLASVFDLLGDRLGEVLADGEIDDTSRAALSFMYRVLRQAAASVDPTAPEPPTEEAVGIGHLEIGLRTYNVLMREGFGSFVDLRRAQLDRTLGRVRNIGPQRLAEIERAIDVAIGREEH